MKRFLWIFFSLAGLLTGSQVSAQTGARTRVDSALFQLSLPELQGYRVYYMQELLELQEQKENYIRRGIEDGEKLLELNPNSKMTDEILIRLADLYYFQEKDDYLNRMRMYDDELIRSGEQKTPEPDEPRLDCSHSLSFYQRIIDEFPQSELVDDAVYNKAFLFEEMREHEKANQVYAYMIGAYPKSPYIPEAHMRLAEYYFNPPVNDLATAITYYKNIMNYKNSPRYDEALYKLGWSYYRLSQYPEAISYFTTLVEGLSAIIQIEPSQPAASADLRDEAIEYIGISFIDFGGSANALSYLRRIGNPPWGEDVLVKLGDTYMKEKEEYENAVSSYTRLLEYRPQYSQAPSIQKKIVECYRFLGDNDRVFEERHKLFATYSPGGAWWEKNTQDRDRLQAYRLTEEALRENFNGIVKRAEENRSSSLYETAVEMGRQYLNTFPEDPYAYMIRWNIALILDTKLHNYKQALQEYLTISLVYQSENYGAFAREKGLASIQDAAMNAIVVADSLVQREKRAGASDNTRTSEGTGSLTTAESWLATAYDNYLKLFPFDDNTPTILANAGALYFERNQFTEALKYFKTLTQHFPESEKINDVQFSILESYFGKKDYESAEIFARRILDADVPDVLKKRARQRLGEAIFLKAQIYVDSGMSALAAADFYRMAVEVPSIEFADRALFNAGREYESIGDHPLAIRAYELLRSSYSGSPLIQDALNNLAFDYGEAGDFNRGAMRYEELSSLVTDPGRSRDALYNAFIFYTKAQNWTRAIETGRIYALRYPDSGDAPSVYFKTGQMYLDLNKPQEARRVFSDFERYFPNSALEVEAHLWLGHYFAEKDSLDQAETSYMDAYLTSSRLKEAGLEDNAFFGSEGLFHASEILFKRYSQIWFTLPQESMNRSVSQKESLLKRLVDQYSKVAAYGTHRLPESVYRIGELYENYAVTWAGQEIPTLDATSRVVREKEISEKTTQLYGRSLSSYQDAVAVLEKVLREAQNGNSGTAAQSDSMTLSVKTWSDRSREKISEVLYQMAEVNTRTIARLLEAPIPPDLDEVAMLEYQSQVLIKAVKPVVDIVIEAHQRNIDVADSLSIRNRWTEASRAKILASINLLGGQYIKLSMDALSTYRRTAGLFHEAVFQKKEAGEELSTSMVNLSDLSKSFAQVVLVFTRDGVKRAQKTGIDPAEIEHSQEEMIEYILSYSDTVHSLIEMSMKDQTEAGRLFNQESDPYYEELLAVCEDNVYFLEQNARTVLEQAYDTENGFISPSPSRGWLAVKLIEEDPEELSGKYSIPVRKMTVPADTTWFYSMMLQDGWEKPGFEMKNWRRPKRKGEQISMAGDSLATGTRVTQYGGKNTCFVRKELDIPGYPLSAEIQLVTDPPSRIFVNGESVPRNTGSEVMTLKRLQPGKNLMAAAWLIDGELFINGKIIIQYVPGNALLSKGGQ